MKWDHAPRYDWTCMDISHTHKASISFRNALECREHIKEEKPDISDKELDNVVEKCYGPIPRSRVLDTCPFCPDFDEGSEKIEKHIVTHLLFFAQISLCGHDADIEVESESGSCPSWSHNFSISEGVHSQYSRKLDSDPDGSDNGDEEAAPYIPRGTSIEGNQDSSWDCIWEFLEGHRTPYDFKTDEVLQNFVRYQLHGPVVRSEAKISHESPKQVDGSRGYPRT
ncbi:hypothetical protein ABW21_db0205712 [Orbilia brochopaga]|nr:hypothetical protein ABW21_db0205712 [Drechslerella brochopaga]